jgi:hypothetical protein
MAVPFALPEDETNNLIVAVIFILSQTRLQRTEENRQLQGKSIFVWDGGAESSVGRECGTRRAPTVRTCCSVSSSFRFRVGRETLAQLLPPQRALTCGEIARSPLGKLKERTVTSSFHGYPIETVK